MVISMQVGSLCCRALRFHFLSFVLISCVVGCFCCDDMLKLCVCVFELCSFVQLVRSNLSQFVVAAAVAVPAVDSRSRSNSPALHLFV